MLVLDISIWILASSASMTNNKTCNLKPVT